LNVRNSVILSAISQYLLKIIGFVNVIIMARLLTPDELGVYAIAGAVVLIASELKLMGTTSYLIREKELTEAKVRSGVGLSIIFSWGLGLSLAASSNYLSLFFDEPRVAPVFYILSLNFIFAPFTSVTTSLLSRNLQFDKLVKVNILTEVSRFLASLVLVLMGLGILGLAWGLLFGSLVEAILVYIFRPSAARFIPSFKGLKPIFKFGFYSSMTNLLARFDANAPDLVIGKLGTTAQVAFFSRGVGFYQFITTLISSGVWPVVLPYLSGVNRDGGNMKEAYIRASLLMGGVCWPILAAAGVMSYPIIMLLFGEQWLDTVPLAAILSIWAILRLVHNFSPQLLMAVHKERVMLLKQLVLFTLTLTLVYFAYPYGLKYVAWAMAFVGFADFVVGSIAVYFATGLSIFTFSKAMFKNVMLTAMCFGVATVGDFILDYRALPAYLSLVLMGPILVITWLVGVWSTKHPLWGEVLQLSKPLILKVARKG